MKILDLAHLIPETVLCEFHIEYYVLTIMYKMLCLTKTDENVPREFSWLECSMKLL